MACTIKSYPGLVLVRPDCPNPVMEAVHEPRVQQREVLPPEPEARERADLEVLEEHVRPLGQAANDDLALGLGEVHDDGLALVLGSPDLCRSRFRCGPPLPRRRHPTQNTCRVDALGLI